MMTYLNSSRNIHRSIVLVDLKVGLQDSDKMLIDMLTSMHLVFMVVLTKADKVPPAKIKSLMEPVVDYIRSSGSVCIPIIHCVAAESDLGYGLHELKANLIYQLEQDRLFR